MFKTNEYFNGQVKSIAYENDSGQYTIGVMANGEYEFGATSHEEMTVVNGKMTVQLPHTSEWTEYKVGDKFQIPAGSSFKVKSDGVSSYLCKYD